MWKGTALFTLALVGCTWISDDAHKERLDADGDGYPWPADCEPDDKNIHPGAEEVWYDGVDQDCDEWNDYDQDHDTYVAAAHDDQAGGTSPGAGDCDDEDALVHPGTPEVCGDHLDNDCDGTDNGCDLRGVYHLAEADFYGVGVNAYDQYGHALAFGPIDAVEGPDLAIGGPTVDGLGADRGAVFVHRGPIPNTLNASSATTRLDGDVDYAQVGMALAWVGDVDGDTHPDLLVGAPTDAAYAGRAYLLHGPDLATGSISQGQAGTGALNARYGAAVVSLGDVNEDGRGDFAVSATGAPYADPPAQGSVHVFRGPASDLDAAASFATLTHTNSACAPSALASGDVAGGGVRDLLVGSSGCSLAFTSGGAAWLLPGTVQGNASLDSAPTRFLPGGEGWLLGFTVASGSDVDGDGRDDVLLGAPGYMAPGDTTLRGMALLYTGPASGELTPDAATARIVGEVGIYFAISVALPGDVNGDGHGDLLIGAPYVQVETDNVGAAFLFYGPVAGDLSIDDADAVFLGSPTSLAGYPVFQIGDLDDDGFDDLFLGAPGTSAAGSIYGILGRGR